jgi:hypothetical protein
MNEYTKNKTIVIIKIRDPNYARRLMYLHICLILSADLLSSHLDLDMEPSLEDKLWLTNPSGF